MTAILGISAFYHDSAAALIVDGQLVGAAQEERFTRIKHDATFPEKAVEYCLETACLSPEDLDFVGFYEKPFLKFERLLETYLATSPLGLKSFLKSMPVWLKQKLRLSRELQRGLHGKYKNRFVYCEHHESHAASAFFPSPFDEAAILTLDGVGEWSTGTLGVGRGNRMELTQETRFPHSLGLLFSAFTYFTGFEVNDGEYKLMGLAPYGEPKYVDLILEKLLDLKDDGSFRLDLSYFDFCHGLRMTSSKMETLLGRSRREPETDFTTSDMDLAASIQKVTEEVMLRCSRHLQGMTGQKKLCLAGGVALNCVANRRILDESGFEEIWIQPAAGDAGGALGVAWLIWHQLLGHTRHLKGHDLQQGSLLGPSFSRLQIRELLEQDGIEYQFFEDEEALCQEVAELIAGGNVVGWFQGRMEYGPRALGNRSILADPRRPEMQSLINQKIKFRESFRPFAPAVLQTAADSYFEMPGNQASPYMLLVAPVDQRQRRDTGNSAASLSKLKQLSVRRSSIPAVTHVDYSARVQTVDSGHNGRFFRLLQCFESRTGCPVLINTSLNVRDEPIVCTPRDALNCFSKSGLDSLVLGDFLVRKTGAE